MPYYRCYQCEPPREFEAAGGECPECHARHPAVLKLAVCHFIYPLAAGPVPGELGKRWAVACRPREGRPNTKFDPQPMSAHPGAVTCPACVATSEFRKAAEEQGLEPHEFGLQNFAAGR